MAYRLERLHGLQIGKYIPTKRNAKDYCRLLKELIPQKSIFMFNNLHRRIQQSIDTRLNTELKIENSEYKVWLCLINLARHLIL